MPVALSPSRHRSWSRLLITHSRTKNRRTSPRALCLIQQSSRGYEGNHHLSMPCHNELWQVCTMGNIVRNNVCVPAVQQFQSRTERVDHCSVLLGFGDHNAHDSTCNSHTVHDWTCMSRTIQTWLEHTPAHFKYTCSPLTPYAAAAVTTVQELMCGC
jgi:hypothetical protein